MLYQLSYCGAVVDYTGYLCFLLPWRKPQISAGRGVAVAAWRRVLGRLSDLALPARRFHPITGVSNIYRFTAMPDGGMDSRVARLCIEKGLKMTEPRRVIARVLSESEDHPDAEALHGRVRELDPTISIATVYRTMKLFQETNIVTKRDFGDGRARYEEIQGDEDHHHHLIDVTTGQVLEFYNEELEALKIKIATEMGFKLVDHHLELFGVPLNRDTKRDPK